MTLQSNSGDLGPYSFIQHIMRPSLKNKTQNYPLNSQREEVYTSIFLTGAFLGVHESTAVVTVGPESVGTPRANN